MCYPQPVTYADRVAIARDFVRRCDYELPFAIDRADNQADAYYAAWPERFYVVDERGVIAYKGETGPFGYHPDEVAAWLAERFPAQVQAPNEVAAQRILGEPLEIVACEYADARPRWRVAIDAAGSATLGPEGQGEPLELAAGRVTALRQALVEQRFFALPELSGRPRVEGLARSIRVTLADGTAKIVHAYVADGSDDAGAPARAEDAGFQSLWELLRGLEP